MPATEPTVGHVPPHLMQLIEDQTRQAMEGYGLNPKAPGAGGIVLFNAMRGVLHQLGMLPEPAPSYDALATDLFWRVQTAILRLRDLDAGHEIPAQGWVELGRLGNLLRETAAQVDHVVSLYEEGKGA